MLRYNGRNFGESKFCMGIEPIILIPPVSTPFMPGCEKKKGEGKKKSSYNSAENRAAGSLWISDHRYTGA